MATKMGDTFYSPTKGEEIFIIAMKTTLNVLAISSLCGGFLLSSAGDAHSQQNTWYIRADAGGNVTRDVSLNEFFGVPVAPGSQLKLDQGVRGGVAGGYNLTGWFAAEGQIGVFANHVNSITGATEVHDVTFGNAPFLANGILQLPNATLFLPYIGAGVGFSEAFFNADHIAYPAGAGNTVFVHGGDADTVFAWQLMAGLRCALNARMGLSVEYRYFHADGGNWHGNLTPFATRDRIGFGATETHAVSLAFDYHF